MRSASLLRFLALSGLASLGSLAFVLWAGASGPPQASTRVCRPRWHQAARW